MSAEESERVQSFPRRLQFTPEEAAVLRRCRFDSTVYRGLPAGILSAYVVRSLCRAGVLGSIGKKFPALLWSGALGVGFYVGVASLQQACFDEIMKLENSKLAEQVRAYERMKRGDIPLDSSSSPQSLQRPMESPPETQLGLPQDDVYTPPDTSQDYYREAGLLSEKEPDKTRASGPTSFDEIRAQRRRQQSEQYHRIPSQTTQLEDKESNDSNVYSQDRTPQPSRQLDQHTTNKSKYGDVGWE